MSYTGKCVSGRFVYDCVNIRRRGLQVFSIFPRVSQYVNVTQNDLPMWIPRHNHRVYTRTSFTSLGRLQTFLTCVVRAKRNMR